MKTPLFAALSPDKTTILAPEHEGDVCHVDLTADKPILTRPYGTAFFEIHPHDVAFHPDASFAMVVCASGTVESKRLARINLQTNETTFMPCAPQLKNPKAIAITDEFAIIADVGLKRVAVLELSTDEIVILTDIGMGNNGCGITISPCGSFIFICSDRKIVRIPTPTIFVWRAWHNQLSAQELRLNAKYVLVWSLLAEDPKIALRVFDQFAELEIKIDIELVLNHLRSGKCASARVRDTTPEGVLLLDKLLALEPKQIGEMFLTAASKHESSGAASAIIRRLMASGASSNAAVLYAILVKDSYDQSLLERWLLGTVEILNPHDHARSYSTVYGDIDSLKQSMLHSKDSWFPSTMDKDQFLCIDAGSVLIVHGIIVQGRNTTVGAQYGHMLVKYAKLSASVDGNEWFDVDNGRPHASRLVLKSDATKNMMFDTAVAARYIRINPVLWHLLPALRCALLVESENRQGNYKLAAHFIKENSILRMPALACLLSPKHSDKALQFMIEHDLVPDKSILKILLKKDKHGLSKWTNLILHTGSASLVTKLMAACKELSEEALSPLMLALACTPFTAAAAVRLIKAGATIDDGLREELLRGGRTSKWSLLVNDMHCVDLVEMISSQITMVSTGLRNLRHAMEYQSGLVLAFQWQDSTFEFLEKSDCGDLTVNDVKVGSIIQAKTTNLLPYHKDDRVDRNELIFDDTTSWKIGDHILVDGATRGKINGKNDVNLRPLNFAFTGCAAGTRLFVRSPNDSAAQCGKIIKLCNDGEYILSVDNCTTELKIDPTPMLVTPAAVFLYKPSTKVMLWYDEVWVDTLVESSHAQNSHCLVISSSDKKLDVTLNEFNHAELHMPSVLVYDQSRRMHCSKIAEEWELEDAITGNKLDIEKHTIFIHTDSSESAVEKTDLLDQKDVRFVSIPDGITLRKGSQVRYCSSGEVGVVSGIDLAPTCYEVNLGGSKESVLVEISELEMALPLAGRQLPDWQDVKTIRDLIPLLTSSSPHRNQGMFEAQPVLIRAGPGTGMNFYSFI